MSLLKTSLLLLLFLVQASRAVYGGRSRIDEIHYRVDSLCTKGISINRLDRSIAILHTELDVRDYDCCWRTARSFVLLGEKSVSKGARIADLKQGYEYGEEAVRLNPRKVEGYYWKARAMSGLIKETGMLSSMKLAAPMKAALVKALVVDPKNSAVHAALAQAYCHSPGWFLSFGDKAKAVSHALQAVKAEPKNIHYKR